MVKMFGYSKRGEKKPNYSRMNDDMEEDKDGPPDYEGKEHVHYRDPGYTREDIEEPDDEPHMKSHVSRHEEHEAEDDYHMGIPHQTHHNLEKTIPRAHMKMDAPHYNRPKKLMGNMVHNVPESGYQDTTGEEDMGPHDMQKDSMPKEHRKKMIIAVMRKKMGKNRRGSDPGSPPNTMNNMVNSSY